MRPLTEEETKVVFEKLYKFIGKNIQNLVGRGDEPYCLRLQKGKVYYVRESIMARATCVSRDKLHALGTAIGKFTHSGKFRLTVGAVDILARYAKYKVWVKPAAEMQFLYGNHVVKSGLGRITDGTPPMTGVVVYSMSDVPLGFGITAKKMAFESDKRKSAYRFGIAAKGTAEARKMDPAGIVVLHQADMGEYLRAEDDM